MTKLRFDGEHPADVPLTVVENAVTNGVRPLELGQPQCRKLFQSRLIAHPDGGTLHDDVQPGMQLVG